MKRSRTSRTRDKQTLYPQKGMRRIFSVMMSLVLAVGLMPLPAFAEGAELHAADAPQLEQSMQDDAAVMSGSSSGQALAPQAPPIEAQSSLDFTIYLTYDEPAVGQVAPTTVSWSTEPADAAATSTLGVQWMYAKDEGGTFIEGDEPLAAGASFQADYGYYPQFEDPAVSSQYVLYDQPVYINGRYAGTYDRMASPSQKLPFFVYGPLVANPTTLVTGYDLQVDAPEPNATPDAFATVTFATENGAVAGTKEIATTWTEIDYPAFDDGMGHYSGRTMDPSDTFKAGYYYRVDAAPEDGVFQALPEGHYFSIFETDTYTTSVNGTIRDWSDVGTFFFGPVEGESDYTLTYAYDDDNLTATVTGLTGDAGGSLAIPASVLKEGSDSAYTVTAIAERAFQNKTAFTGTLTFPDTVTTIGAYAFSGCSNMTGTLTIPASVTSIGNSAFQQSGFKALALEDGEDPLSIGNSAFYNCNMMTGALVIPARVTAIGEQAFSQCGAFTSLSFAAGSQLASIAYMTFNECEGLQSVSFAADGQLETIGEKAFYECGNLSGDLTLPNSVTAIGKNAFYRCSKLEGTLTLPANLESIGEYAFYDCGFTGDLTVPSSLGSIPEFSFYRSGNFDDVTLAAGITSIGRYAFTYCGCLGNLTISDTVTTIEDNAFKDFGTKSDEGSLTGTLTLSSNLTTIGQEAFKGSSFTGALVIPDSVTSIGESAFCDSYYFSSLTLPTNDAFTTIPKMAFGISTTTDYNYGNKNMGLTGTLTIPANVTEIGERAFQWNRSLGGLAFAEGSQLATIGDHAFYYCDAIESGLALPATLTTIGDYAFARGKYSGDLVIPDSVTSLGEYAFYYCEGFNGTFHFPDNASMTAVPKGVFRYCTNLVGPLQLPDRVTEIGFCAFEYCKELQATITGADSVLEGIEYIDEHAFYCCQAFGPKLTVPSSVAYLGKSAFGNCSGLTTLDMQQADTVLRESVFRYCENLVDMGSIPATVTQIDDSVFQYCFKLSGDVVIPEGVQIIGEDVFFDCRQLTGTITIPSTVTSLNRRFLFVSDFTTIVNNSDQTFPASYALSNRDGHFVDSAGEVVETIGKGTYVYTENEPEPVLTDISSATVTVAAQTYTGKALTPAPTVKLDGVTLTKNTHYTVSYKNNTNAGKATVTVSGVQSGGYTGTKSATFKINPKAVKPAVALSKSSFVYSGKVQKPGVTVKVGGATLAASGYDVSWPAGCKSVGAYTVKVTLKGNYSGSASATYRIVPKGTEIAGLTPAKQGFTVKWKQQVQQVGGYQVRYALSKAQLAKANPVTVKGAKITSKKISKLKAEKRYLVQVRTFKQAGKATFYSSWSKVKAVKTK